MRPIHKNTVIQIDVVGSACHLSCANCTRHVGHHRGPQMMTLDEIRTAIASLLDSPCRIGLMGGEPALHPKFREVLALWRDMIPDRRRREFWTSGHKWDEYEDDIRATFDEDRISYNDHTQDTGRHAPLLVASEEIVPDPVLRKELIDNCPFQERWSASIRKGGAFFCEIAGSLAELMGKDGWPVEPGWWDKTPEQFQDQVETFCHKCSGCVPLETLSDGRGGRDGQTIDVVSPGNLRMLYDAGSPKVRRGGYEVCRDQLTREDIEKRKGGWRPREFRDFVAHTPEDVSMHVPGPEAT